MTRFYQKNELAFSITWIALYVILFSAADQISANLGTVKIVTAPMCLVMIAFLAVWIGRNGLAEKYGLGKVKINYRNYLYFLPLVVIASTNLWRGVGLHMSVLETILYVVSMLCVGFLEEVIFRGFLFKALCRQNVKRAILISSITFGIGHIVNLLNGAEVFSTLLQICYASAVGFLFTIIFYRSKSLVPCILTHSAVNSLSAFGVSRGKASDMIVAAVLTVVSLAYAVWMEKANHSDVN
ncbi:MAG: CPBP family intramembrane metalloprotease [Lachnospiraceae bacterium]|nr:CPBP family intramembrane metalloprotease [Lachnospiraceae bacterium]